MCLPQGDVPTSGAHTWATTRGRPYDRARRPAT